MEDKKVLTIYRVGVLCMIFYAYPNDLVCGNRGISGDAWLINWSTYVHSLCKFQTLTLTSSSKTFSPLLALGIFMKRVPNMRPVAVAAAKFCGSTHWGRMAHGSAPVKYAAIIG